MNNTIHRFWAGRPMPEKYIDYGEEWVRLNPDYFVVDWNLTALRQFPDLEPVFDDLFERDAGRLGIELYVQIADVMGYALIERYGGVYVNCDMQPVRALPELPDKAWASYENTLDWRIVNAAIGAPAPGDPFWKSLLHHLPERYFSRPGAEMVEQTGPAFLTDHARANPDQLHVFPVETFNPVHWKQIEPGGDASGFSYPEGTIAVHHWGHKKDGRSNHIETATQ